MNVIELPLSDIKPYWRNPRDNQPAIDAVKKSIQDYGFNAPIIIDLEHVIIAGHTRYRAMAELGKATVPCIVVDLPKQKAKEYRIVDNKTAEFATWDLDKLLPELREIKDIGELAIYFPEYDLATLLGESVGSTHRSPSAGEIEQANSDMHSMFQQRDQAIHSDYVEVTCPHCTRDFSLSRDQIERGQG